MSRPGRFTPSKDPVPISQEAGWAPGMVWTGAENLASTGIRSPDHLARSKSLYQLSYPGPYATMIFKFETNWQLTFQTPYISEHYQTYSSVCCRIMVYERERENNDNYMREGNTVNKL